MDLESLARSFDRLRVDLERASSLNPEMGMLNAKAVRDALGEDWFCLVSERLERAVMLKQVDALCRFLIDVVDPSAVGERENGLLRPVTDEVHGRGEFPNLWVLRGLLESRGARGAGSDVVERLLELLSVCEHESSPNCSARTPDMRGTTNFRRGPGGSPNAARRIPSSVVSGGE